MGLSIKLRCRNDIFPSTFTPSRCMDAEMDFEENKLLLFFSNKYQVIDISSKETSAKPMLIKNQSLDQSFSTHFMHHKEKNIIIKISPNNIELFDGEMAAVLFEQQMEYRSLKHVVFDQVNEEIICVQNVQKNTGHLAIQKFTIVPKRMKSARKALDENR